MSRVREWLEAWRPSNITGGAPFYPLFVLFGLNAADELDQQAFSVLIPNIRDHFRLDIQGILTVVSLVVIGAILVGLPIAYYADRFRRTRMAAGGATMWGVFSFITGIAPVLWVLGIARFGAGMGRAVNTPTHNSLLADYYDVDVRPKVFGVHRAANSVGQFLGPAIAGVVAFSFGWRAPFILFAIPTMIFVVLALRLQDPTRGEHERRLAGANEETVATEEAPPSFTEAWRILWQIRSLRRIWYSLPFLGFAFVGFLALLSIYYEQLFGFDERQRGFLFAFTEPAQLIGLAAGVPIAYRLMARDPGLGVKLVAVASTLTAGAWLVLVVSRTAWLSVVTQITIAGIFAVVGPTLLAMLSLTIPPRARSMGFTVGAIWYLPALFFLPIIGAVADEWGVRQGMALMIPILLIGAAVISTAAKFVRADIAKVRASTAALSEVTASRRRGETKLLLVKDLDVSYGNVQVLFGVDFEVDEGEIVALLGTNGAGKSTLLRAVSGLTEAGAGAIVFDGHDMTYTPPHEIVNRGVIQVPGGRGIFPTLTVEENLKTAAWIFRRDEAHTRTAVERVFEYFPVLRDRYHQQAGALSGGEQQMLTLGMAFVAKPRLLMIDELSLGLAPILVEQLLEIVRAIRDQGTTIILVEQSVNVALNVAETAYFMEKGEIRFHGPTKELLDRPDILRSVFLEGAASVTGTGSNGAKKRKKVAMAKATEGDPGSSNGTRPVLEVAELSRSYGGVRAVDDVSFTLHDGQILGIIGPNGAGKTTLFDLVSGFLAPDHGRVVLDGDDITTFSPDLRARYGLGRSFQDARLFPALTVAETIALALDRSVEIKDPVAAALNVAGVKDSERKVSERVEELIELMGLGAFRDKFTSELSTGSRRIVDLACVLAHEPKVLLFDEPSSGIAQRETEALGPLLLRIREATDSSLLVIEHDMPLVTSIADEMLALDLGRVVTRGAPDAVVNHPQVVASYLGTSEDVIARSGKRSSGRKKKASKPKKKKASRPKRKTGSKR